MRHAWTRLFRGLETFLMKRKKFFDNSFLVQILIKCGTWWPISKIGNPERPDAIVQNIPVTKKNKNEVSNHM